MPLIWTDQEDDVQQAKLMYVQTTWFVTVELYTLKASGGTLRFLRNLMSLSIVAESPFQGEGFGRIFEALVD